MTRIRVLQQMSGFRNGQPWPGVGEFMEVSDDEAASLTSGQTPIAELAETGPGNEPPVNAPSGGVAGPANADAAGSAAPKPDTLATAGPAARAAAAAKPRAPRASTAAKK